MERRRHLIYTSWLNSGLYPNQLVLEVRHRFWIYFLESWITKLQKALPVWASVLTLTTEEERVLWWSWLKPRESLSYPAMEKVVLSWMQREQRKQPFGLKENQVNSLCLNSHWGTRNMSESCPRFLFYQSPSPQKGEAEMNPHLWRKNVSQKALLICLAIAIPSKQKKGSNQHLISKH